MSKKSCCLYPILGLLALLVLTLVTPAVLGLIFHDIEPFDDSDFTIPAATLADEDNAYFALLALQDTEVPDEVDTEVRAILDGGEWDETFVIQTLADYSTQLQQFEAAAAKPGFQDPVFIDPSPDTLLPYSDLISFLHYVRLNSLHALALMKTGQEEKALHLTFLSIDLGAKMMDSKSSLMSWYIASTVQKIGLENLAQLIPDVTDPTLLQPYAEKLPGYTLTAEDITHAFKGDYSTIRGIFKNIDQNPELLEQFAGIGDEELFVIRGLYYDGWSFYYHPTESQKAYYEAMKAQAEEAVASCEATERPDTWVPTPSDFSFYWSPNALGKIVIEGMTLNASGKYFCETNAQLEELEQEIEATRT
jgi:hypothetical protein